MPASLKLFHKLCLPALLTAMLILPTGCSPTRQETADSPQRILWHAAPAESWETQALPIGNGRLGGMIFGGVPEEHIQFNEDSLWLGDEQDTGAYQSFGDLYVTMSHQEYDGYRRELDIGRAVHTITYSSGGTAYTREYFASYPAQVMVFRFSADTSGAYTGNIHLTDAHDGEVTYTGNTITVSGSLDGGTIKDRSFAFYLDYEAEVTVLHGGGTLTTDETGISFNDCDTLTILLSADTNYLNQRDKGWMSDKPLEQMQSYLAAAARRPYEELREEHIADYQSLFGRLSLDLGDTPDSTLSLPTNERLDTYRGKKLDLSPKMKYEAAPVNLAGNPDPDLEELMFQYARYLMISSSRPGSMPANLQGVWNHSNNPPWRSDYHTDVNIEMNYWFVDAANLSGCFQPLAEWVNSIREVRKEETKTAFNTRGWLTHAENGIFGGSTWKWSKGDAAWVAQNLWDHYAFTGDREYLASRAYPVMKELCEFWEDHLKELPGGTLVSPDGFSPEHGPTEDGVSFDQQLVWDLFSNFTEASEILGRDEEFRNSAASMKARLLGPQIGSWGAAPGMDGGP